MFSLRPLSKYSSTRVGLGSLNSASKRARVGLPNNFNLGITNRTLKLDCPGRRDYRHVKVNLIFVRIRAFMHVRVSEVARFTA